MDIFKYRIILNKESQKNWLFFACENRSIEYQKENGGFIYV